MVHSMTGFGRGEAGNEAIVFTVEIKSVNHKYLDVNIRLGRQLFAFETQIKNRIKQYIGRGKLDVGINYEFLNQPSVNLAVDLETAAQYVTAHRQLADFLGQDPSINASELSRCPDVVTVRNQEFQFEEYTDILLEAVDHACQQLLQVEETEGMALQQDLLMKLALMEELVADIKDRSPEILADYVKRLQNRMAEVLDNTQISEERILMEAAVYADRICTDEEVVRLSSHIAQMRDSLQEAGGIGRKLDFLAQEMNREANTILSKSNDLAVSKCGIELKTCIEKIREQVQNLE